MIKISAKTASSLKDKIQGLMLKNKPYPLMIKTHFGIHTFGVKFPIDVLILNNKNKVISAKQNLKPNRIFLWNPLYNKILELPVETIEKKGIKVNDFIDLMLI